MSTTIHEDYLTITAGRLLNEGSQNPSPTAPRFTVTVDGVAHTGFTRTEVQCIAAHRLGFDTYVPKTVRRAWIAQYVRAEH